MLSLTRKEAAQLFGIFALWRILLFLLAIVAPRFLIYEPAFPYAYMLLPFFGVPQWMYSWTNFDGLHYLTIARGGYKGYGLIQAFFPVYPLAIRYLEYFTDNFLLSSLYISNISFFIFLVLFFSFIKTKFSTLTAWRSIFILLLFPTSFFFVSSYNESLFMCFVMLTFIAADKRKWLLTGISIAAASATRVVGIFLIPAVITQLFLDTESAKVKACYVQLKSKKIIAALQLFVAAKIHFLLKMRREILLVSLGAIGLLSYMTYLWYDYGDPLYFFHVQAEFGSGRQESLVVLPQVFWRYVKIIVSIPKNLRWWAYVQEFLFTGAALTILIYGCKKAFSIKPSWLIFSLIAILLPTLTGTLSSMPRYVLVAFPLFVILAQLKLPTFAWVTLYVSMAVLLILNTILFIQGYWVA